MQQNGLRRFGWLFALLGLIVLLVSIVAFVLFTRLSTPLVYVPLAIAVAMLGLFAYTRLDQMLAFLRSRQALYGTNVLIAAVVSIGITVIVNAMVISSFDRQLDLTATKEFTLSEQTRNVLAELRQPIQVLAFFSTESESQVMRAQRAQAEEMLERYQRESQWFDVRFVDPIEDPKLRTDYDVEHLGTMVFELGDRRESVTTVDEQKFTTAIMRLLRDEVKVVYFLSGHGERDIEDHDEQLGMSQAKEALEAQNYSVQKLPLITRTSVPADCAVLVIAGPKKPISEPELQAIREYMQRGGKLLALIDPPDTSDGYAHEGLTALLAEWGILLRNDVVVEQFPFGYLRRFTIPYVQQYEFHPITRGLPDPTAFPTVRSVDATEERVPDVTVTSLVKTSSIKGMSWGETRWSEEQWKFDPEEDAAAPVSLAIAMQRERDQPEAEGGVSTDTRAVVVGDSDFATNWGFTGPGSGDLFLNSLNWLAEEEDLIAIRAKPPEQRRLRALSRAEERLVALTSVFAVPLLVLALGLGVWWWRRRLT